MLEIAKNQSYYNDTIMNKVFAKSYIEKMSALLEKVPKPIEDKRHNLYVYFNNNRARSNETRYEHILSLRHKLLPSDIKRIQRYLGKSLFKKDKERKGTCNYYIKRNSYSNEYIKVSVQIEEKEPTIAIVKTIYITNTIK